MLIGSWIYIDPDDFRIELIDIDLDLDVLCDLLRCDATDAVELFSGFTGYIDGEGAWQERQQEWELNGKSFWGPMLIFKGADQWGNPRNCNEEDLELIIPHVRFLEDDW